LVDRHFSQRVKKTQNPQRQPIAFVDPYRLQEASLMSIRNGKSSAKRGSDVEYSWYRKIGTLESHCEPVHFEILAVLPETRDKSATFVMKREGPRPVPGAEKLDVADSLAVVIVEEGPHAVLGNVDLRHFFKLLSDIGEIRSWRSTAPRDN
jgi:hypothetical protein